MVNLSFINYFILRGSYGKIGMDPGDPFQYVNKYVLGTGMTFGSSKVVETIVRQSGVANPFSTWEKQTTSNIGFEAQFLNNLFHVHLGLFYYVRHNVRIVRG